MILSNADRLGRCNVEDGPFEVVYDAKWDKTLPWCVMNNKDEVVNHFQGKEYADKYEKWLNSKRADADAREYNK